eukprot:Amastigsp_a841566_84.p3 type:complete len:115 gc:universal Amastigsp_a841566_84:384-40(-)
MLHSWLRPFRSRLVRLFVSLALRHASLMRKRGSRASPRLPSRSQLQAQTLTWQAEFRGALSRWPSPSFWPTRAVTPPRPRHGPAQGSTLGRVNESLLQNKKRASRIWLEQDWEE